LKKTLAFIICILMLCGCSGKESAMDQAIAFRQKLLSSSGYRFECEITADYGDILHRFSVLCEMDDLGDMRFHVTEPDSISGISGVIRSEAGELTFDENVLAFPLLADGYISPVSAPWVFWKALRGGYLESCGRQEGGYLLQLNDSYEDSLLQIQLYTDNDFIPRNVQMLWQGRSILSLAVKSFSWV